MTELLPLGDSAFLARFSTDDVAARWADAVRARGEPWLTDVVTAYSAVAVYINPEGPDPDALAERLRGVEPTPEGESCACLHVIPVVYDGPDLGDVAGRLGLGPREVVEAHSGEVYRVAAVGFLPGFPYAGDLPDSLRGLPRRHSPRTRVPQGSVAIAGRQTAIYPAESPGGWHLLGRTPLTIVDVPGGLFPIRVGDRLRFVAIDAREFEANRGLLRPGGTIPDGDDHRYQCRPR